MVQSRFMSGAELFGQIEEEDLDSIEDFAEHVASVSVQNSPLETGALRRSATVSRGGQKVIAYKGENGQVVQAGEVTHGRNGDKFIYVSHNTPYAWVQHEKINFKHPNGGSSKYLENAHQSEKHLLPKFIIRGRRLRGRR